MCFAFSLQGSVIPKALAWAIPCAGAAVGIHFLMHKYSGLTHTIGDNVNTSQVWAAYNFLIGFLLTFRTGQAYSRWWEGGSLLQQARGEWFNAYSSLIAFCSSAEQKADDVRRFQRTLLRLMSMLYAAALDQLSQADENNFEVIDFSDIDTDSMIFLQESDD